MVFQGSGLVFHGSRWVLRVIHVSRLVCIGRGRFFMVPGGFSCFFIAPGLVFMIPGGFLSSLMVPGWFKSELSAAGA